MPDESPELIEQHMQETRESLTQKVTALEDSVVGGLHNASETVNSIIDSVKTVVPDTLTSVKDNVVDQVKATFDVSERTRERPWAMIGGAAALGFIAGIVLFRKGTSEPMQKLATASAPPKAAPQAYRMPGWLDKVVDRLADKVGDEVRKLGEVALATASDSLQRTMEETLPKILGNATAPTECESAMPHGGHRNGYHPTGAMS
jgi:ElaB/YqjD/DUF883 family membrane-anchored ribosome-binding protein